VAVGNKLRKSKDEMNIREGETLRSLRSRFEVLIAILLAGREVVGGICLRRIVRRGNKQI
jgi:hypothetical protein